MPGHPGIGLKTPSQRISQRIAELGDWRGKTLARMRKLIQQAGPQVVEEWKWTVPVWSDHGIVCTGESYKSVVKLTFAKGAALKDPAGLFNSSLDGKVRRAIDLREGEEVDASAFKALVREAVAFNRRNIRKAAGAAKRKRTVAHLPKKTRTALGKEGAKAAKRKRR
jgi:hypothetical protein